MVEKEINMPRPIRDYRTASQAAWKEYKKKTNSKITYKLYKEIVFTLNKEVGEHILETGCRFRLPFGMGDITIGKKRQKIRYKHHIVLPIDWVESKRLKKTVYILNSHTDEYRYRWFWFRPERNQGLKFISIWAFNMSRLMSRGLAKKLKIHNSPYKDTYAEYSKTFYKY